MNISLQNINHKSWRWFIPLFGCLVQDMTRMRSSLVVRASDCQCTSCNGPGFDPSIRRHSGIWGAADEAVLNIVRKKEKKIPQKISIKKIPWHGLFNVDSGRFTGDRAMYNDSWCSCRASVNKSGGQSFPFCLGSLTNNFILITKGGITIPPSLHNKWK